MQQINDRTKTCYAVLRGKANQHLFEEEIQKMRILDLTARMRADMEIQILAYCVLDNELHLLLCLESGQSAEDFLDQIARCYEESCIPDGQLLRVDYLPEQNSLPDVNSSVSERGILYHAGKQIRHFRKNAVKELSGAKAALRYWLKLHLLPVRRGIVADPEDYWWCSYLDYMGRQWLPVADPSKILSAFSANPRQAVKLVRRQHLEALEKNTPTV